MDEAVDARLTNVEKGQERHDEKCDVRWDGMYKRVRRVEILLAVLVAISFADHVAQFIPALGV